MVFKKAAGREGRGAQDTEPAHFLCSQYGTQGEIDPNGCSDSKQGAEKLSEAQAEKDSFLVIPDFFWYFYFYFSSLL